MSHEVGNRSLGDGVGVPVGVGEAVGDGVGQGVDVGGSGVEVEVGYGGVGLAGV